MSLAVVARYWNLPEAHVAAAALRSAGVRAEVFDDQFGVMFWTEQSVLGGFRVVAPADELAEAAGLLASIAPPPSPETLAPPRGSKLRLFGTFLLAASNPMGVWGWIAATRRPALWKTVGFVLLVVPTWLAVLWIPLVLLLNLRDLLGAR
jgi:hypothetical protein